MADGVCETRFRAIGGGLADRLLLRQLPPNWRKFLTYLPEYI